MRAFLRLVCHVSVSMVLSALTIVAGLGPVPVSLSTIITVVTAWTAAWLTIG